LRTTPSTQAFALAICSVLIFAACKKVYNAIGHPPVVNAGPSQTIKLPLDSVNLSGSATSTDSKLVAYLWSEVSGPNIAAIASEGSPSTRINQLTTGTYIFQLMALDSLGETGVDSLMVTVNPPDTVTLTLSPSQNPTEALIWGDGTVGLDKSGEGSPEIDAAAWTYGGTPIWARAALQFDLGSIPSGATIYSAKLTLFSNPTPSNGNLSTANFGTDNSMFIQQITASWDPTAVKWYNQPQATATGQISIPTTSQPFLDLTNIDVTNMVKGMVQNNASYGFLLRLQNETYYSSRIFCSSKYSDVTKHPKFVIQYKP